MTKICRICGLEKDVEKDFYSKSGMKDGKNSFCKKCSHKIVAQCNLKRRRHDPLEKIKEQKYKTIWRKNNPHKRHAERLLHYAIEKGRVKRQPCEFCGKTKTYGHHDDYNKPLEVRWVCPLHHHEIHAGELR